MDPDYTVVEPGIAIRRIRGLGVPQPLWMATRRSAAGIPLVAWATRALRTEAAAARRTTERPHQEP